METYFYYKEDEDNTKQFEEFTIETLAPGETEILRYKGIAKEIEDTEKAEIYSTIKVSADGIEEQTIETIRNEIKSAKMSLKLEWAFRQMVGFTDAYGESGLKYKLYVKNLTETAIENQEVNFVFPSNSVEYNNYIIENAEDYPINVTEAGESTIITITIPSIEAHEEKEFYIPLLAKKIDTSLENINVQYYAYTTIDNERIKYNISK